MIARDSARLEDLTSRALSGLKPGIVGVAVSGGGDSMALVDLIVKLAPSHGLEVAAATVNHGLRASAAEEAAYVARHCKALGIDHQTLEWRDWSGKGNLQAEARAARYGLLSHWARQYGIRTIALGHTQDDQAETFLMRLSRAAGVDGLASMAARFEDQGVTWIRPLLAAGRDQLRIYLRDRAIRWCEDPSNDDTKFSRVQTRQTLDLLEPLGLDAARLSQVSDNLAIARDTLRHYTRIEARRVVEQDRGDIIITHPLNPAVPAEIERRLINAAIVWINGAAYTPRAGALQEMDAAFAETDTFTLAGCVVTQVAPDEAGPGVLRAIRITREWQAVKSVRSGTEAVWDGRWQFTGPHADDLHVGPLGEAVSHCPDWRDSGLPRRSLLASPAVWRENELIAAPLAGFGREWTAKLTKGRDDFAASLL